MEKRIYTVIWDAESLSELFSLLNFELAEEIQDEVDKVLAINPHGNFRDIKVNIKDCITNIKPLNKNLKGWWRIRINQYRIGYKIEEDKILVRIFKVCSRENFYNSLDHLNKDFLNNL